MNKSCYALTPADVAHTQQVVLYPPGGPDHHICGTRDRPPGTPQNRFLQEAAVVAERDLLHAAVEVEHRYYYSLEVASAAAAAACFRCCCKAAAAAVAGTAEEAL
jgi:hypothetical protein